MSWNDGLRWKLHAIMLNGTNPRAFRRLRLCRRCMVGDILCGLLIFAILRSCGIRRYPQRSNLLGGRMVVSGGGEFAHLEPTYRRFVALPNEERIVGITVDCWIWFDQSGLTLGCRKNLLTYPPRDRMPNWRGSSRPYISSPGRTMLPLREPYADLWCDGTHISYI